ncbi:MAG TPA: radical SAM protein, partial [Blastocatellia bacterium]|nr:radical SAM protein [Blastocatellia bacterium]
ECPFDTVFIDVTHRCNMGCRNCYLPNRTIPDLDAVWIKSVLSRLPRGRKIKFVGGEPTLREDLPELIRESRRYGHHPIILTNGLKLADRAYVHELKQAGLQIAYLSFSGVFDDDLYEAIDAMRCADKKKLAFENLRDEHMFTSLGMIIVRGINEHAVAEMLKVAGQARNVRELKFRSVGEIGRSMKTIPLLLDEMLEIFAQAANVSTDQINIIEKSASSYDFIFGRFHVQLTQWPDLGSMERGRLTPEGQLAPFFEHVMANDGGY